MTGALLPADGIAADDDEVVLGGSDGRTARGTGTPGERASVAQAGVSLLLVLFGSVPDAHPQILSLVFDSMSIRKTLRQHSAGSGVGGSGVGCSGRWLHLHALHTHSPHAQGPAA